MDSPQSLVTLFMRAAGTLLGVAIVGSSGWFYSESEGRTAFPVRLICWMILEATISEPLVRCFLAVARMILPYLPGATGADAFVPSSCFDALSEEDNGHHDSSIAWPSAASLKRLPEDWRHAASKPKRPFFLNHVRGSRRCKHAALRCAAACTSLVGAATLATFLDGRPLGALGLLTVGPDSTFGQDFLFGVLTGGGVVVLMFLVELALGWVRVLGLLETFAPAESFTLNLLWDSIFHIAGEASLLVG